MSQRIVPAENFCQILSANVDNDKLDDAQFREFVRNTLPIVVGANHRKTGGGMIA